ncbi:uncharacterized protein [Triticum aestivum]|uniref:uncharacterized protein n=1 Tax=Triticum aestivum TaxID=4565 RepID=UPI001D0188D9|nr:uncharacterized protein LOC123125745 [Triticum aestivum]
MRRRVVEPHGSATTRSGAVSPRRPPRTKRDERDPAAVGGDRALPGPALCRRRGRRKREEGCAGGGGVVALPVARGRGASPAALICKWIDYWILLQGNEDTKDWLRWRARLVAQVGCDCSALAEVGRPGSGG